MRATELCERSSAVACASVIKYFVFRTNSYQKHRGSPSLIVACATSQFFRKARFSREVSWHFLDLREGYHLLVTLMHWWRGVASQRVKDSGEYVTYPNECHGKCQPSPPTKDSSPSLNSSPGFLHATCAFVADAITSNVCSMNNLLRSWSLENSDGNFQAAFSVHVTNVSRQTAQPGVLAGWDNCCSSMEWPLHGVPSLPKVHQDLQREAPVRHTSSREA